MGYEYLYNWIDRCIQIDKRESIFKKRLGCKCKKVEKEDCSYHFSPSRITSNDISIQLANVKHIGFEVIDSCNLHCKYCAYGDFYNNYDIRRGKKMDMGRAKKLIDFLFDKLNSEANKTIINDVYISFYGGEPLMNFNFIQEMVDYTQKKQSEHVRFHYMMTTNAVYLKKYISFLYLYDFSLTISLDGSKENNMYRKFINNKSSYDIVYNNLKYVQDNYLEYFKKRVEFNAVIHSLNNPQEVFQFIYYEFGKIPYLSGVNPTGINPQKRKEFEKLSIVKPFEGTEEIMDDMKRVLGLGFGELKQLQRFVFQYSGNCYDNYNELLVIHKKVHRLPTATCMPFSKRIFMTVNNKILPCERIGHQYALGEVSNIDVNINNEQIADKYNKYYDILQEQCNLCYNKLHCTQCLFSIDNLDKQPICDQFADKQNFSKYIRMNMGILAKEPHLYKRIMTELITVN